MTALSKDNKDDVDYTPDIVTGKGLNKKVRNFLPDTCFDNTTAQQLVHKSPSFEKLPFCLLQIGYL